MNVTLEKIDELNSTLKIKVAAEDYQANVDKTLKEHQKEMKLPGFRPGKIPISIVKKMYGKSVLIDEINKQVTENMYKYIQENNINILGDPLPNFDKDKRIDWNTQTDFEFSFELGLSPVFELEPFENLKVKYYNIAVTEQVVDKYIYELRKRHGNYINPEVVGSEDMILAEFTELDENNNIKEGGLTNKSSILFDFIKNKSAKEIFIGLKIDDIVDIDMYQTFEDYKEISYLLGISQEKAEEIKNKFRVKVITISHQELAPVDEELFKKVYKADNITSEEQLRERIKKEAQLSFDAESDIKFSNDVINYYIENTKIELPDAFLERWLVESSDDKMTLEEVEKEYPQQKNTLKWQLIENRIFKENNIEVTHNEVKQFFKGYLLSQYQFNDGGGFDEQKLDEIAENFLKKNKKETKKIYNDLYDEKLKTLIKERVKKDNETISYEDFVKLANAQQHHHDHEHEHNHEHDDHDHHH